MITVGKIRDAHGLKGELFTVLFAKEAGWIDGLKAVRLIRSERLDDKTVEIPYDFSILRHKKHKAGLILKLKGLEDRTAAEGFQGARLQITSDALTSRPGDKIFLKEIEGFNVLKKGGELVGPIVGFSSNNAQDLILVKTDKGQFELPLVNELIVKLDFKKRELEMDIPEGLLGEEG